MIKQRAPSALELRAEATTKAAKGITQAESDAREAKTAKLKEARLIIEAQDGLGKTKPKQRNSNKNSATP